MGKAKLSEKLTVSAEGMLDINEDGLINLEIEDIGVKSMAEILKKFNGCSVKFSMNYSYDSEE